MRMQLASMQSESLIESLNHALQRVPQTLANFMLIHHGAQCTRHKCLAPSSQDIDESLSERMVLEDVHDRVSLSYLRCGKKIGQKSAAIN